MTNEKPLSAVGSALAVFDDDKLIHKSNLVFNNVFNGQSNRSIFICSTASAYLSGTCHSAQVDIIHQTGGKITIFLWQEKSHHAMQSGP